MTGGKVDLAANSLEVAMRTVRASSTIIYMPRTDETIIPCRITRMRTHILELPDRNRHLLPRGRFPIGRLKRNVLPSPSLLSKSIHPPWRRMISREMYSPTPIPP